MQTTKNKKICILGSGNFGTSLAQHLANLGHKITLWTRSEEILTSINQKNKNPKYLSNISLHPNIKASTELKKVLLILISF